MSEPEDTPFLPVLQLFVEDFSQRVFLGAWSPRSVRTRFDGESIRAELARILSINATDSENIAP